MAVTVAGRRWVNRVLLFFHNLTFSYLIVMCHSIIGGPWGRHHPCTRRNGYKYRNILDVSSNNFLPPLSSSISDMHRQLACVGSSMLETPYMISIRAVLTSSLESLPIAYLALDFPPNAGNSKFTCSKSTVPVWPGAWHGTGWTKCGSRPDSATT